MIEGPKLLVERVAFHDTLDSVLRTAGFRMGQFELLYLTGLDVSVSVMESIHSQFYGDDRDRPATLAQTGLKAGLLGRRTGEGFYRYGNDASLKSAAAMRPPREELGGGVRPKGTSRFRSPWQRYFRPHAALPVPSMRTSSSPPRSTGI